VSVPISVKREDTVRLARTLKQQSGKPMARVIHEALEDKLQRLNQCGPDPEQRLAEMHAISRRIAKLPNRDRRSANEIIGYDENGLPDRG
jgi:antitoxin VapB